MTKFLFLFLDGIGLGPNDPETNPFARAALPNLRELLGKNLFLASTAPFEGPQASLLALDARLGVEGLPQSATGQATLLTGKNIPAAIGYHYGPKPNPEVAVHLKNGNLFNTFTKRGLRAALLNAYPPGYFAAVESGKRIYSAIPLAVVSAGLLLRTADDLFNERAIAADFTGQGWREHLGLPQAPLLEPDQAGYFLAELAQREAFAFFEYWLSDYAGHRQDMTAACQLLETFDAVLGGLVQAWQGTDGLILLTSDHGNLEDLTTRRHTNNPVPALVIGPKELRQSFCKSLQSIEDVAPSILKLFPDRTQ